MSGEVDSQKFRVIQGGAGGDPAGPTASFSSGGGPPYDPGMEARVSALEASNARVEAAVMRIADDVATIRKDLGEIRKDVTDQGKSLARLDGRVGALPTTLQMIGFVLAVLALAGIGRYFTP